MKARGRRAVQKTGGDEEHPWDWHECPLYEGRLVYHGFYATYNRNGDLIGALPK